MFEDSLLESGGRLVRRNPWTTAFSFGVQLLAGGILVLMSLVYTETLPTQRVLSLLEAPVPPPPSAPAQRVVPQSARSGENVSTVLVPPIRIPEHVETGGDVAPPGNPLANTGAGAPDGVQFGTGNSVVPDVLRIVPVQTPAAPVLRKIMVSSGVAQGLLIRQVKPEYPPLARQARVQGTVVLQAVIGKDGTVQDLHVVSGHPLLTGAAIAAARQWLYRPYYLDGAPVEVDTQINVIFTLSGE